MKKHLIESYITLEVYISTCEPKALLFNLIWVETIFPADTTSIEFFLLATYYQYYSTILTRLSIFVSHCRSWQYYFVIKFVIWQLYTANVTHSLLWNFEYMKQSTCSRENKELWVEIRQNERFFRVVLIYTCGDGFV